MSSSRTSRVNSPIGRAQRRAGMKKANQSTIKLNQLPADVLLRIASHLPARHKLPPVILQEVFRETAQDFPKIPKHRFEVVGDSRGAQMVRQVLGKRRTVHGSRVEDYYPHVSKALARDGRRRGYFSFVTEGTTEEAPIFADESNNSALVDEPISTRWRKEHRIHMKHRGGTANDLLRVSRSTHSALRRPEDKSVRKTLTKRSVHSPA